MWLLWMSSWSAFHISIEEGHDLASGAGVVGGEGGVGGADGDLVLDGPENGIIEIGVGLHVGKGVLAAARGGVARAAPEEGHHLAARAAVVGREGGGAGARCDLVFHGPENGLVEIV